MTGTLRDIASTFDGFAATGGLMVPSAPSEHGIWAVPTDWKYDQSKPAIVVAHGAGGLGWNALGTPGYPGQWKVFRRLCAWTGCPVLSHDLGGATSWGNALSGTRLGQVLDFAEGPTIRAKPGKHILMGGSMGGLVIENYAKTVAGAARTAAIVGIIPLSDLTYFYVNNVGGTSAASVGAAWGVTWPASLPVGADPTLYPGLLPTIPMRGYYSSTDTTIVPITSVPHLYRDICGGEVINVDVEHDVGAPWSTGPWGHTETSIGSVIVSRLVQWLRDVGAYEA